MEDLHPEENEIIRRIAKDSREIVKRINQNRGLFVRWVHKFCTLFFSGPRKEINHDWLFAFSFYYKTIMAYSSDQNGEESREFEATLSTVLAYLILSKSERNFALAWSYVNLAITHLTLIVSEKDLGSFTFYLSDKPDKDTPKPEDAKKPINRKVLHAKLLKSSHKWNIINTQTSFKLSTLITIGIFLFLSLLFSVLIAEYLVAVSGASRTFEFSYVLISLLGIFGGGLSAFFTARSTEIDLDNCALVKVMSILRMLLGACGSFVIYIILQFQPVAEISNSISNNYIAFLTVGIIAGFSERFFVSSLNRIVESFVGKDPSPC